MTTEHFFLIAAALTALQQQPEKKSEKTLKDSMIQESNQNHASNAHTQKKFGAKNLNKKDHMRNSR